MKLTLSLVSVGLTNVEMSFSLVFNIRFPLEASSAGFADAPAGDDSKIFSEALKATVKMSFTV